MTSPGRIDTHQHIAPPGYRARLEARGESPGGIRLPACAPAALDMMGANDISTGVLSVSAPGVHFGDDADARALARQVNDDTAEVVRDNRSAFGMFAVLPLPDVDVALLEVEYALDVLGADGVVCCQPASAEASTAPTPNDSSRGWRPDGV